MINLFARRFATEKRLLRRSCESLLGICAGMLADQKLNQDEVYFLDHWLAENAAVAETWPGSEIARRVRAVLADGRLTRDEMEHLKHTLSSFLGGTLEETGSTTGGLPIRALPFDEDGEIDFGGRTFCLTGEFFYGTRSNCSRAIEERGGTVLAGVRRDLNYLIVGALANPEWKHSSFGTKIEKAMIYRGKGLEILIIPEDRWTAAL